MSAMSDLSPADIERHFRKVLEQQPDNPEANNNLGAVLQRLGRTQEAEDTFRRALALRPDYMEARYNLALTLQAANRLDEAEAEYRGVLTTHPAHPESHHNLGNVLKALDRLPEAEASYRQALAIRPQYPLALNNLANVLRRLGRYIDADIVCREAIALQPRNAESHNTLGTILEKLGRLDEAETAYRYALSIRPDLAESHYNLGIVLHAQERLEESEASYRTALSLQPENVAILNNLGGVMQSRGRPADAVACYQKALAIRADLTVAWFNLGTVLKNVLRLPEAEAAYRQALAQRPDYADAQFGLATLLLSLGRYEEGWRLYDARYFMPRFVHRRTLSLLSCPRWQGQSLQGCSLLVWQEDGLGDMIQFGRYLSRLKAMGASRLTVACLPPLRRLLSTVEGVDEVIDLDLAKERTRAKAFAYWVSPMSVPLHFGLYGDAREDAISPPVYLKPDAALVDHWRARLDALPPGLRVGLVWKGNPLHHNDAFRSLPSLALLAPLWEVPGVSFVSLQKGEGEDEARTPPEGQPLLHLGGEVSDFADSAAIVAQLDLVIGVDTSTAHLAASLGTPCWIMLPAQDIDWRWQHGREDSVWYPDVRLFRQGVQGAWAEVVERVARRLRSPELPGKTVCVPPFGMG
jgi:tetratricopeptide (TPR) repeat protein